MLKLLALVSVTGIFTLSEGGIPGLQCPAASVLPCDEDCQTNHGAANGTCGAYNNCYCDPPTHAGALSPTVQCQEGGNFILRAAYQSVCNLDCQCQHGANTGTCNFTLRACVCAGRSDVLTCAIVPACQAETDLVYTLLTAAVEILCGLVGSGVACNFIG